MVKLSICPECTFSRVFKTERGMKIHCWAIHRVDLAKKVRA